MKNYDTFQQRGNFNCKGKVRGRQSEVGGDVIRDDKFVERQLKKGIFDRALVRGYAEFDRVFSFLRENGLSGIIDTMGVTKGKQGVRPGLVIRLLFIRALLGNESLNSMQGVLRDPHVLRQLGFSWGQIENGYSRRTKREKPMAVCVNTLSNEINIRIEADAWKKALDEQVKMLVKRNMISDEGVFGIDSTPIIAKGKTYEGAGRRCIKNKWVCGYKLAGVQQLEEGKQFVVAAGVTPVNRGDMKHLLPLVERAKESLEDKMKVLVLDSGYYKKAALAEIKLFHGIDFVIHAGKNLKVYKHNVSEAGSVGEWYEVPAEKEDVLKMEVAAGPLIETVVLERKDHSEVGIGFWLLLTRYTNENGTIGYGGIVTSIPLTSEKACRRVHLLYKLRRPSMENKLFQEMKEGMGLNNLPSRKFNGVFAHLLVSCLVFNYMRLYLWANREEVDASGIKTFIRNHLTESDRNEIAVYCGSKFGVFNVYKLLLVAVELCPAAAKRLKRELLGLTGSIGPP